MDTCITMLLMKIKTFFNAFGTSTAWPTKTDFTEKIGKSLLLDNCCMGDYLPVGNL